MIDHGHVGLSSFYKIHNNLTQGYLRENLPPVNSPLYGVRHPYIHRDVFCNSSRHQNSFFPNTIKLWNNLGKEFQVCKSIETLKKYITSMIKPPLKSSFHTHIPHGTSCIFQLRVGLSPLNSHKKRQLPGSVKLVIVKQVENTEHFLLKCPLYLVQRTKMTVSIMPILRQNDLLHLKSNLHLYLYGSSSLSDTNNRIICSVIKGGGHRK